MSDGIEQKLNRWSEQYLVGCLLLGLVALTWTGVGSAASVGPVGLALCVIGLAQSTARVDTPALGALTLYCLLGLVSAYASYGSIDGTYPSNHLIFPAVYLLTACLDGEMLISLRRLCAVWAGVVATAGIFTFALRAAVLRSSGRLGGFLGNPNAMGIFLVLGWFAVLGCESDERKIDLSFLEPILLAAMGLTLSMGSFLSMAVGIAVLLIGKARSESLRAAVLYGFELLSRASLGIGTGLLLYLAATRTGYPACGLLILAYGSGIAAAWKKLLLFLQQSRRALVLLTAAGVLVAVAAILSRPSAVSTFAERLEMMGSALTYLRENPLLGVGPYRWRGLDQADGGTFFNTWHIHNMFLHVGAELGLAAMCALLAAACRLWKTRKGPARAGFTAFLMHNLIDTSFFYPVILLLELMTAGEPPEKGWTVKGVLLKLLFGGFALVFAYDLFRYYTA